MPGIMFNGTYDPYDKEIFQAGEEERQYRHRMLDWYWKYYDGNHKKFLKTTVGTVDDNVVVNLCSQAVDRFVSFMFPELPKIRYPDESRTDKVKEVWNELDYIPTFLTDIGISGLVSGHVFARVDNSSPDGLVRFVNLDPRIMSVFWDKRNIREPLWYRMTWTQLAPDRISDIYYIEDYVPAKYVDGEAGWYILTYEWNPRLKNNLTLIDTEKWDYELGPIVDWKAQPMPFSYYGPSLLKHLHVNDVVNFLWSNTNRILRFHAHPKTIILGAGSQDLQQTSIDEVWAIPVAGAEVFNLEMQSDLKASLEMMDKARAAFFAQTHVVDTTTQRDKIGQITNFGLQVLFSDMLDHTKLVQQLYGNGIRELFSRAMTIMGDPEAGKPFIGWPNPLPVNRTEQVNAVKVEQSIGLSSPETLSESLDRDFDDEQMRMDRAKTKNINLFIGASGIKSLDELPLQKNGSNPNTEESDQPEQPDEWDDSERLQRAVESI